MLGKFRAETKHTVWWNSLCKEERDKETQETGFKDEILNQCRTAVPVSVKGGLGGGGSEQWGNVCASHKLGFQHV